MTTPRSKPLYQDVTVRITRIPGALLWPRWQAQMYVNGSDMCGNEYWPSLYSWSYRAAKRRILRKARRHRRKWQATHEREMTMLRSAEEIVLTSPEE